MFLFVNDNSGILFLRDIIESLVKVYLLGDSEVMILLEGDSEIEC